MVLGPKTAVCVLLFAVLSLIVCLFTVQLWAKYSPVYTTVECIESNRSFDLTLNGSGAYVEATIERHCTNPNPFEMRATMPKPGEMLVAPEMVRIGSTHAAPLVLPAMGNGTMVGSASIFVPASNISRFLGGEVTLVRLEEIEMDVVLSDVGIKKTFFQDSMPVACSFNLEVAVDPATFAMHPSQGHDICSTLLENGGLDRMIKDTLPANSTTILPVVLYLTPEKLAKVKSKRNAMIGTATGVSALLTLLLLSLCVFVLVTYQRRVKELKTASGIDV